MKTKNNLKLLTGNTLKIIAAISMVIDHIGFMFFPDVEILRILGRLAFPIYAFMIAEGCKYTKNKLRYFLTIFSFAAVCQIVYYLFDNSLYMCILVTFSLSILVIYALQYLKTTLFSAKASFGRKCLALFLFVGAVMVVYLLNRYLTIDYGFFGCMVPVFASLLQQRGEGTPDFVKKPDCTPVHVLCLGIGLLLLAVEMGGVQYYALFALPVLLLYSGTRGKWNMKYFFYIFYPAHLAILQGIYMLF